MSRTFQYTERPCGVVLGRRGLIKVVGVCAVVAGATGWGYCPAGPGRAFHGLLVARVFRHIDEQVAGLGG